MRLIAVTLAAAAAFTAFAQDAPFVDMKPPAEMSKVDFLVGEWAGKDTMFFMGQKQESTSRFMAHRALNSRYVHSMHKYKLPGAPVDMEGMHMLTYDPDKKMYVAYWFDGAASNIMEMSGNFEGDKLVMISKPTQITNAGEQIFRATWSKKTDKDLSFVLELKQGEEWVPMIVGNYTKVAAKVK